MDRAVPVTQMAVPVNQMAVPVTQMEPRHPTNPRHQTDPTDWANMTREKRFDQLERGKDGEDQKHVMDGYAIDAAGGLENIKKEDSPYRKQLKRNMWKFKVKLVLTSCLIIANTISIISSNKVDIEDAWYDITSDFERKLPSFSRMSLLVAIFELGGLLTLILKLLWALTMWHCHCYANDYMKWYHLHKIAWVWIRTLSKFSSIMFVGHAHPAVILEDLAQEREKYRDRYWCCCDRFIVIQFVLLRLFAFVFGLAGLAVKAVKIYFRIWAWEHCAGSHGDCTYCLGRVIFLTGTVMNQALNMIDVSHRLRMRTLQFVFAGEDGIFEKTELLDVDVYCARVAKNIWEEFRGTQSVCSFGGIQSRFNAFAVLAGFNYQDVQRLAIRPPDVAIRRQKISVGPLRNYAVYDPIYFG